MKKDKTKKYDLKKLEDDLNVAYFAYEEEDNQDTRTDFFRTMDELSFAILTAQKWKGIDHEEVAYEYSLYLFTRVVLEGFRFKTNTGRIPFQNYIAKSIIGIATQFLKDTFERPKGEILRDDMEFLIEATRKGDLEKEGEDVGNSLDKSQLYKDILEGVKTFYTVEEIKRLLPISMDVLFHTKFQPIPATNVPKDIRDFCVILICVSKRVSSKYGESTYANKLPSDTRKALLAVSRSSAFLAIIASADKIDKELFLALDIDSLYRLSSIAGGKAHIKVPSLRELDTIIGAATATSKQILDGKPIKASVKEAKEALGLNYSTKSGINYFISKALKVFETLGPDKATDSFVNVLMASMVSVEKLFTEFLKREPEKYSDILEDALDEYINLLAAIRNKLRGLRDDE
jgi:hypothetical protein